MSQADQSHHLMIRDRLLVELKRLDWAKGLSSEALAEIAETAEFVEISAGETVLTLNEKATLVYFVVTGRLQVNLHDSLGKQLAQRTWSRGAVLGLFSAVLDDPSQLLVEATEPSTAIRLSLPDLLKLTSKHTDFQLALFRLAANVVRQIVSADRRLPVPAVVGIVHQSPASRPVTGRLIQRLVQLEESIGVASDDDTWRPEERVPFHRLIAGAELISNEERQRLLDQWREQGRLLIDLKADQPLEHLKRLLSYADVVLWCLRPSETEDAVRLLLALQQQVPKWREKVRLVWLLNYENPLPPYVPALLELASRDFKLSLDRPTTKEQGNLLSHGVERIIRHLRGIQIGLALGGGAARGMAHLGVLRALETHGIHVDMLAGTSAGAMTGSVYAAGLAPAYATQCFKRDLQLPWLFRQLPAGGYWYLLYKYRRGQFGPMLRKYLDRCRMEQLLIPVFTIAVDLVEGGPLIRGSGDATANILESINLPPLALPIYQAEQALVDGGLLNNVPADVLVQNGCNFVIASSVTTQLEKDFLGIRSKKLSRVARFFSTLQVVMRQNIVQSYSMNAVGVQPADFVISPNVTAFDLSEFTRADEMADVGDACTNQAVEQLRSTLCKLDPKLFAVSAT